MSCRRSCCSWRPTPPASAPQPLRGKPNEPANVTHTARFVAGLRGVSCERARAYRGRERGTGTGPVTRQASLRRLRAFDVRPNRELGQNFLIDDNILGVIGRAAELDSADVVLEVGGGLGASYRSTRCARRPSPRDRGGRLLEAALREALDPHPNAELHLGDAVRIDLATLDPSPRKVVANLPYGVAATVILKSIAELPEAELWVAMVQREVADRLAAAPGAARATAPRRSWPSWPATCASCARCRARSSTLSRTWIRPSSCCAAQGRPRPPTSSPSCTPASPIGERLSPDRSGSQPALH